MKLGTQIGLNPGHIVLDGDPAPPPSKGQNPQFSSHICCGQMAGWIKMPHGREVGLSSTDVVLDGDASPPPENGGRARKKEERKKERKKKPQDENIMSASATQAATINIRHVVW